jgi:hypothetical protein
MMIFKNVVRLDGALRYPQRHQAQALPTDLPTGEWDAEAENTGVVGDRWGVLEDVALMAPEVIVISPKDEDRPIAQRLVQNRTLKLEISELARFPVPGNGPDRTVLWDRKSDPKEQAQREAARLARMRGEN